MILTTIRDGERVAVWKPDGSYEIMDGPKLLFSMFKGVRLLKRYSAQPDEYVVVRYLDGRTEHLPGPVTEWFDPVVHNAIEIRNGIELDANEAIVVYRERNGEVDRRLVRGPALHFPASNEWLHEFRWHGSGARGEGHEKRPRALSFTKLRVIPDQMYFDVNEVRTRDEALLTIKAMVFFELMDIDRMLDQTHDPISDFINALTADIIGFAARGNFEEFKLATGDLNELESYPQLVQRAERIGYRVNKVAYRGYHASAKLQSMHDDAIETRTRLVLDGETERQAQDLSDLKLERELEREAKRRDEEAEAVAHKLRLQREEHEEMLRQGGNEHEAEVKRRADLDELQRLHDRELKGQRAAFLAAVHELGADLTPVLVAENRNPDKLIEVNGGGKEPALHLHEG